jgi:glycine cleavage system aminomethyltransferase T
LHGNLIARQPDLVFLRKRTILSIEPCINLFRTTVEPSGTCPQIGSECRACRSSAAVFNMSYFGKLYLVGRDAHTAADFLFSNDMRRRRGDEDGAGATVYTCMLNARGGTEADLTVSPVVPGDGAPYAPHFEGG